jgi:hypothetical protein
MPLFLIPFLIIIGIFAFGARDAIFSAIKLAVPNLGLSTERSVQQPPARQSTLQQAPSQTLSPFSLETVITQGPAENMKINDGNEVTFEFEGFVSPKDTTGSITFETKVEGVDSDWRTTSSRQRTITLSPGPKQYTFLVRSKLNDQADPTPAARTFFINTSPYFGKVKISSVKPADKSSSSLITLTTQLTQEENLTITGWRIQGQGGSFIVPRGIENISSILYIAPNTNIVAKRSDTILLSGAQSPFGFGAGNNFRPNSCMGYLKAYYTFSLSIPSSCPNDKPKVQQISFLSEACQEFILNDISFSSCKIPNYSQNSAVSTDAACVSYITENLNYNGCYQRHSKESNFLKNEWHIYMNTNFVRQLHDSIELTDQNGLFVDRKIY